MAKKQTPPNDGLSPEERLQADNELSALNLEMQYGAQTFIADDAPPELIQQFLANIAAFEKEHRQGEKTTVYKRIGSPAFANFDLLDADTLPSEIKRLLDILEQHGFMLQRPDTVADDAFYEFIINDIFEHEVDDIQIPGMLTYLDYADFYPDEESLIAQTTSEFLLELLDLEQPFTGDLLSETCRDDHRALTKKQALQIIEEFRRQFKTIIPVAFSPEELLQPGNGTYQVFGIKWEGIPKQDGKKQEHEGMGIMQVAFEDGQWLVQGVNMPGFKF
jgi:hypothetical protein